MILAQKTLSQTLRVTLRVTQKSLFSEAQENEGVEPYQYELSESDNDETDEATSTTDGSSDESSDEDIARLTSISWLVKFLIKQYNTYIYRCECGNCISMPTVPECVCCCEIDVVKEKN